MLPVDGFFFDIVKPYDCSCRYCVQGMKEAGLDPTKEADRLAYNKMVLDNFRLELSQFVRERNPDTILFSSMPATSARSCGVQGCLPHFELESLPAEAGACTSG